MQVQNINTNQSFSGKITIKSYTRTGKVLKEKIFRTNHKQDVLIHQVADGMSSDKPESVDALSSLIRLITKDPLRSIMGRKSFVIDLPNGRSIMTPLKKIELD